MTSDGTPLKITTIRFETLDGDPFQIGEMPQPVAILTFLRYVG